MKNHKNNSLISTGIIAENKQARFNYTISETFESGIVLLGSEVKSLRLKRCNITGGFIAPSNKGELFIHNLIIPEYIKTNQIMGHIENRIRKLLLNKREINKISGIFRAGNVTIVPLKIYFNQKGFVKILIGIGKGKKQYDKREIIKKRDWDRHKARLVK